ncbi:MAG: leucyl aminopeptidase family protein, partial [Litoreibacter sp.]|nr:leucyl aminopeptidase family protein [Litoreibacter sp.]
MLHFAQNDDQTRPLHILDSDQLEVWRADQPSRVTSWVEAQGFAAKPGEICLVPGDDGRIAAVLVGARKAPSDARSRFSLAGVAVKLPKGSYSIASPHNALDLREHALGWLLSQYSFERYKSRPPHEARLVCPDGLDAQ